jgi:hypothetical protein
MVINDLECRNHLAWLKLRNWAALHIQHILSRR